MPSTNYASVSLPCCACFSWTFFLIRIRRLQHSSLVTLVLQFVVALSVCCVCTCPVVCFYSYRRHATLSKQSPYAVLDSAGQELPTKATHSEGPA